MSQTDRDRWDNAYRERLEAPLPSPDPLLFEFTPPLLHGETRTALDLAAGFGQNGLWLAEQGYTVDLIDASRVALLRAQDEMQRRELRRVNLIPVDLDEAELSPETYDLVCVFRFLSRDLMKPIRACIRPGGRIVYQTFNTRYLNLKPDMNPDYLLKPGELSGYFADWQILHSADERYFSQLVAVKP